MTESPFVIVGCGKLKQPKMARAGDMYVGAHTRAFIRWARSVTTPDRVLILSAKHGLIPSTDWIAPYQASFVPGRGGEPPVSPDVTARQIASLGLSGPVITLAGAAYRHHLVIASQGNLRPYNPFFPLLDAAGHHHGTGYQAQLVNRWTGRIPA